jgi:membrane protein implicated in regulation of membrane protease activity
MSNRHGSGRAGWLRENGLSLFFGAILLATLVGQAFTGLAEYNSSVLVEGLPQLTIGAYVTSAQFAVDVAENWQSEYLQFLLYIVLTVWLVQRGSPESKKLEDRGRESDEKQQVGRFATPDSPPEPGPRGGAGPCTPARSG